MCYQDVPRERIRRESPGAPDDFESSGDSGDEYVQQQKPAPKAKRRTRARRGDDEGERRPGTTRKRKRRQLDEIDLSQLPPEQGRSPILGYLSYYSYLLLLPANKVRLDMQIEAILKPKKASRPKRKKNADEDVLDRYADEEVSRLREAMLSAAQDDELANKEKLPATSKLRLLPQVMEVLRK